MEKTPAVDNTRADHWCTLQNHFAIGGVKTMMSSPSVVRETRVAASTGSKHTQTSAVNEQHKKMLVRTETVAPQYSMQLLMPCTFQCVLSFAFFLQKKNERQTKSKTWKSAFPRGRAKVTLCEWTGDQHELPTRGGIRSALRSTWRCKSKHKQPSG